MPAFSPADNLIPAIGYIRVSMAREEMISPELQRASIVEWAARTGHRIIDWVIDLDKTGRNFKRKIMHVIERVEAGEARAIGVWKYSRFGRTREGVALNLARVEKAGGQLESATEPIDASSAVGRLQRGMIMEFNAFESDRAGEQWREAQNWRRDHGLPGSGRPRFGYIWHRRKIYKPDGSIELQEERYEPEPEKRDVIADLYRRYTAGEGFLSLAIWLNDHGHTTVTGGHWTDSTLRRYMDSGFAAGYLRVHDQSCSRSPYRWDCPAHKLIRHPTLHHQGIITDEAWALYQNRRAFTKDAPPRSRRASYPLTGLVRCGLCRSPAIRKQNGRKYVGFVCSAKRTKGSQACNAPTLLSVALTEAAVRRWLAEFAEGIAASAAEQPAGSTATEAPQAQEARRVAEMKASLAKLEAAIAKHMRVYALSADDDPDGTLEAAYLETLRSLRSDKARIAVQLRKAEDVPAHEQLEGLRAAALPVAVGLLAEWGTLRPERINVMLRKVVRGIYLRGKDEPLVIPTWEAEEGS